MIIGLSYIQKLIFICTIKSKNIGISWIIISWSSLRNIFSTLSTVSSQFSCQEKCSDANNEQHGNYGWNFEWFLLTYLVQQILIQTYLDQRGSANIRENITLSIYVVLLDYEDTITWKMRQNIFTSNKKRWGTPALCNQRRFLYCYKK